MHPSYQLVEGDQITGPHTLAVLRQKAEIRVIRPDTPVRPIAQPPEIWRTIRDCPELHALLFVAKTAPKLGTSRFQNTNEKTDAESAPVDVATLLRGNVAHERATIAQLNSADAPDPFPSPRLLLIGGALLVLLALGWILFRVLAPR